MKLTNYYYKFQTILQRFFPKGSLVKALILKVFLNRQEKHFFYLIAPADSVRTKSLEGYLHQKGWWNSLNKTELFTDSQGKYIPWFTYSAIDFLIPKLDASMHLLEYGSGASTLFWATYLKRIASIEHQITWYNKLINYIPTHVKLYFQPLTPLENYLTPPDIKTQKFDIVVIDGRQRVACCKAVLDKLTPRGVVILDDSQRDKYLSGTEYLLKHHFKALPFWGLRHCATTTNTCTTIFYRTNNCLNI